MLCRALESYMQCRTLFSVWHCPTSCKMSYILAQWMSTVASELLCPQQQQKTSHEIANSSTTPVGSSPTSVEYLGSRALEREGIVYPLGLPPPNLHTHGELAGWQGREHLVARLQLLQVGTCCPFISFIIGSVLVASELSPLERDSAQYLLQSLGELMCKWIILIGWPLALHWRHHTQFILSPGCTPS
jgi:hypothetical protein